MSAYVSAAIVGFVGLLREEASFLGGFPGSKIAEACHFLPSAAICRGRPSLPGDGVCGGTAHRRLVREPQTECAGARETISECVRGGAMLRGSRRAGGPAHSVISTIQN